MNHNKLSKIGGEWDYVHDEIIDRIKGLTVKCPECESIIYDDDQYQCMTCGGGSEINVLDWIKRQLGIDDKR